MVLTLPAQSYIGWKAALTILHVFSFSSSVYRLFHRFKIQRVWWDDYLVILPTLGNIIFLVALWVRFPGDAPLPPSITSTQYKYQILSSFWFTTFLCITIVWASRACLALSIARVFPVGQKVRSLCLGLAWFMAGCWAFLFIVINATCQHKSALLHGNGATGCKMAGRVPLKFVFLLLTDILSDSLLIIIPFALFWRLKLPKAQKRLILAVFCGSIMTMLASVAFAVFTFGKISMGPSTPLIFLALSTIESTLSCFVANLAVVITCIYQYFTREPSTSPSGRRAQTTEETSSSSDKDSSNADDNDPVTAEKSHKVTTLKSTRPSCSCADSDDGNTLLSFNKTSLFSGSRSRSGQRETGDEKEYSGSDYNGRETGVTTTNHAA